MTAADESAADVRAIRALLRAKTTTGLLPFFQRLTWAPQNPTTRPPHTAERRLLIGRDPSDGGAIYAHYFNTILSNKVIAYYKDGSIIELYRYVLDSSDLEAPFRYLMELPLTDPHKHSIVGAYVKASFSLKGVTRDITYVPTGSFESLLGRAVVALGDRVDGADGMASTTGNGLQNRRAASSVQSLTSASVSSKHPPSAKVPTRRPQHSSSSSSQASEENTIDFDEDDTNVWKRTLGRATNRTRNTSQFGMFSPAKPRSRPQRDGIASPPIDSHSVNAVNRRKSLGMFSDALSARRVNTGFNGRNRVNGESSARNTGMLSVDSDPMDDDETLFIKNHPTAVESETEIGKTTSLAICLNSGPDRATRERFTNSSLSSSPSSLMNHENEEDLISRNGDGAIDIQNETENFNLDKQAQDYLEMETSIDHSGVRIAILEKKVENHLSKQTTDKEFAKRLEEKASTIEKEFKDEGVTRRAEVRKRLEAQIAVEIAAIDEDIDKKIVLGTATVHQERIVLARSIEESLKMRQEEEAKIREEQRVVFKTRKRLQALKKAGGFDLGEVVNAKRQKKCGMA